MNNIFVNRTWNTTNTTRRRNSHLPVQTNPIIYTNFSQTTGQNCYNELAIVLPNMAYVPYTQCICHLEVPTI